MHLFDGYRNPQPGSCEAQWNKEMSKVCEVVEWLFCSIASTWVFLDFWPSMRTFKSPMTKFYIIGAFLVNLRTFSKGSRQWNTLTVMCWCLLTFYCYESLPQNCRKVLTAVVRTVFCCSCSTLLLVLQPVLLVASYLAVHDIWDKNDNRTRSRPIFRIGFWPQPAVCRYVRPAVPVRSPTVPARAGPQLDCHCPYPYPYPAAVARNYST